MATEIQRILIKYEADIKELRAGLDSVQKELKDTEKASNKATKATEDGFDGAGKSAKGFASILKSVGGAIAAAFTVREIIAFGKQLNDIQKEAQGVRQAFDVAFGPTFLDNLRKATAGTISDLELMKQALRAKEFGIPEKVFAKGLQFARVQANKLGLDVDFLTESFVLGLGRKSPLILDNLAINTTKLNEKIAQTGDFYEAVGQIIDEILGENAAVKIETLADRQARLNAQLENLKLELSDALLPLFEALTATAGKFITTLGQITSIGFKLNSADTQKLISETQALTVEQTAFYTELLEGGTKSAAELEQEIAKRINRITEDIQFLKGETRGGIFVADDVSRTLGIFKKQTQVVDNTRQQVINLTAQLDALKNTYDALGFSAAAAGKEFDLNTANIAQLKAEIDALDTEIGQSSDRGIIAGLQARQAAVKARLDALLGTIKEGGEKVRITQAQLSEKFLEEFDLSVEIDKIGLSTESALDRFYKDRFEQLARFSAEFEKQASELNLFGRTEQEQGDFDALGMSTDEYLDQIDRRKEAEIQAAQDRVEAFQQAGQEIIGILGDLSSLAQGDAEKQRKIAVFQIAINQALALSRAVAAGAGIPFPANLPAILAGIGAVTAAFAQIKALESNAPGFAVGTSDAPGGLALVGEKGPEYVSLPKGSRVFTADATKKERSLIDALNSGKHEEFIYDHYLKPFAARLAQSNEGWSYDDFQLRQAIRSNKVIELGPKTLRKLNKGQKKVYH